MQSVCFALLDDAVQTSGSRLYTDHVRSLRGFCAADLTPVLDQMQTALQQGLYAVGLFHYELGEALLGITEPALATTPLFEVLLFAHCQILSAKEVSAYLQQNQPSSADPQASGIANSHTNITQAEFEQALAHIHAHLEAGDSYQVNYTYRLRFTMFGPLLAFYMRLRQRQPVPYGAIIALPDGSAVLSFSPELFMRHAAGRMTAQPMKGTAPACGNAAQDAQQAQALAQDSKNRAENVMIVDLLRNDMGRVAEIGSVQVPALFEVQRYGDVLQMTSTVTCRLRPNIRLSEIFHALFPCGSITGAPKRSAMQIIRTLEPEPRGLYTGAIGWFDAPPTTPTTPATPANNTSPHMGDFCLSVPIRTLQLQPAQAHGLRQGEMGVGAGIVHDSVAAAEYRECHLKASFLTDLGQQFALFETMRASAKEGCPHLEAHLQRLATSAHYFGFTCNLAQCRIQIEQTCRSLPPDERAWRLKLSLDYSGQIHCEVAPLATLSTPVSLILGQRQTPSNALFLQHKTTQRAEYDRAWRAAEQLGAFDTLFFNEHQQLAEGGRCNVFIRLDGHWYTPPLTAGVLPGIMRTQLLRDPAWAATEQNLSLEQLRKAQQMVVCNALRGVMPAKIRW